MEREGISEDANGLGQIGWMTLGQSLLLTQKRILTSSDVEPL